MKPIEMNILSLKESLINYFLKTKLLEFEK